MSYLTNADIEARLGELLYVQLTDDAGLGTADEGRVTEARLAAEGLMNSYLARRHAVPIDTADHPALHALLRSVALDLVEYRLHARRPPVPDEIRRKYEAAVGWLERAATGEVVLPAKHEISANVATGLGAGFTTAKRVMSRDELQDV